MQAGPGSHEVYGNMEVISQPTARPPIDVIERLARYYNHPNRRIYVATSDYVEQRVIFGQGASHIGARECADSLQQNRQRVFHKKMAAVRRRPATLGQRLSKMEETAGTVAPRARAGGDQLRP